MNENIDEQYPHRGDPVEPIQWIEGRIWLIDQTGLPNEYRLRPIDSWTEMAEAIKTMVVRGAPAIGVAAAYGLYLGAKEIKTNNRTEFLDSLDQIADALSQTRPTAINLFWAIARMLDVAKQAQGTVAEIVAALLQTAQQIHQEDIETCQRIGANGLLALPKTPSQLRLLTHCNAGALATAGYGTALGVVRSAWMAGRLARVYADETRPRLQGAKLTTWECVQEGIPVTAITDSMAAHCLKLGLVDAIVVGADRIAANGDTANKIGTYGLAIAAKMHNIPFFVAAPLSTIDFELSHGQQIPIEERDAAEIYQIGETTLYPEGVEFFNPAFDVTPAALITAIICERGVFQPDALRNLRDP